MDGKSSSKLDGGKVFERVRGSYSAQVTPTHTGSVSNNLIVADKKRKRKTQTLDVNGRFFFCKWFLIAKILTEMSMVFTLQPPDERMHQRNRFAMLFEKQNNNNKRAHAKEDGECLALTSCVGNICTYLQPALGLRSSRNLSHFASGIAAANWIRTRKSLQRAWPP